MATARLTYKLPPVNPRQRALSHVIVNGRVVGSAHWAELNRVPVPEEELIIEQLPPGTWEFQAIVVDDLGVTSAEPHPTAQLSAPFEAPGAVTDFSVTLGE